VSEVLAAPRVITGDETVTDGAVVVDDHTVGWVGPAAGPSRAVSLGGSHRR
jgi:hypothetical protein